MGSERGQIVFIGPSELLFLGIAGLLKSHSNLYNVVYCNSFKDAERYLIHDSSWVVIIDGLIAESSHKQVLNYRKECRNCLFILLIYQYINNAVFSDYDQVIRIDQKPEEITSSILNAITALNQNHLTGLKANVLTERETNVLRLLVKGLSAKDIADQLNISVNTVITHKKNISFKIGIKSLAGLTIYAVTSKIVSIESIRKE